MAHRGSECICWIYINGHLDSYLLNHQYITIKIQERLRTSLSLKHSIEIKKNIEFLWISPCTSFCEHFSYKKNDNYYDGRMKRKEKKNVFIFHSDRRSLRMLLNFIIISLYYISNYNTNTLNNDCYRFCIH